MPDKKVSIKETPRTSLLATASSCLKDRENGNGVSSGTGETKPPPTFEEMWFDDPIEGREAQRLALELRKNVVLRAEPMRIYLERTGTIALCLQGLQHLAKARPSDPAEWLAAFLLKNNPRRNMIITPPKIVDPNAKPEAKVDPIIEPIVDPKADPKKKK